MKVNAPLPNAALGALIHQSFIKASQALSIMLSRPIELRAPNVEVLSLDALPAALSVDHEQRAISVHGRISGGLKGAAALVLSPQSSARLVTLLTGQPVIPTALTLSDIEVLQEVGNIVLNACIAFLGDRLESKIRFQQQRLDQDDLSVLLSTFDGEGRQNQRAILARSEFRLEKGTVSGYFLLIVDANSLTRLRSKAKQPTTC
ncbi:MAG: hypothetical protein D6803_08715 [Anaerolineae bacterium]|nr:MAG: hypothetical protein D6803_08715 [Anaerolineae bacterium]